MGFQKDIEEFKRTQQEFSKLPKGAQRGFFIVMAILIAVVWRGCFYESSADASRRVTNDRKINAVFQSQEFVKDKLKAPSTADFQNAYQASVVDEGNNTYFISSYVDAENSFGAHLRMKYKCRLEYTNDGMVKLTYFDMND